MGKNSKLEILFDEKFDKEVEERERKGSLSFLKILLIILAGLSLGVIMMLLSLSRSFATSFLGGLLGSLIPSIFLINYCNKNNNI